MTSEKEACRELFACTMCGDCCKGFGGTYVNDDDIAQLAGFLKISIDRFVESYCRPSGNRFVIAQGNDGYCVFWDKLCRIHPVKPKMCRQWPFIRSVLVDAANWKIMAASCPGMRTHLPEETICNCVRRELADS